jgi:hypothetical protein
MENSTVFRSPYQKGLKPQFNIMKIACERNGDKPTTVTGEFPNLKLTSIKNPERFYND